MAADLMHIQSLADLDIARLRHVSFDWHSASDALLVHVS